MDRFWRTASLLLLPEGWPLDFAIPDMPPLLPLRTVLLCAPCILGQGCSSQVMDFFLWKVVEKTVQKENTMGGELPQERMVNVPSVPGFIPPDSSSPDSSVPGFIPGFIAPGFIQVGSARMPGPVPNLIFNMRASAPVSLPARGSGGRNG